jgi:hypothetical protein
LLTSPYKVLKLLEYLYFRLHFESFPLWLP